MRRPTARRQQPGVALFPFLAVLICTMGSLIVLLVMVVQQARAGAHTQAQQAQAVDPEQVRQLKEQEEDLQWQADMLQQQREAFAQDLNSKRLELSHLEDHIRQLEDGARKLIAEVEALRKSGKGRLADSESAQQQLAELEREIDEKKKQVDAARKELLRRRPAYAIIPYDGPHGTQRRPMYIECTEAGIVLQPEGVVLSAEDFQGPMGPGNPLDAALRATREHWKRSGLEGEPYPLIVVRPTGAVAFGACRSAMKHWESEFGYELVDENSELKYPPADPQLAITLQRTVLDARQRQLTLAAAMPNRFASETKLTSFRAEDNLHPAVDGGEPGLGFGSGPSSNNAGPGLGGAGDRGGAPALSGGGSSRGPGSGGSSLPGGLTAPSMISAPTAPRYAGNGATGGGTAGQPGQPGNLTSGGGLASFGSQAGQAGSGSNSSTANPPSRGYDASSPNSPSQATGGTSYAGGVAGGTAATGSKSPQGGNALGSMGSSAQSGAAGGTSSAGTATAQGASSGSASDQASAGSPTATPSLDFTPQKAKARKAVKNRGENWGLPNSSPKATAITRPIRIECYAEELRLLPEKGDLRTPLVVPIEGDLTQNLDALVDAVWRHMDRWGIAVLGGYWKPILTVDVKQGGEQRFLELQQLLRGSGIEVERKQP
jgi:hypothetical protein